VGDEIPYETLLKLEVTMDYFMDAMKEVEPSAIREVFVEVPDVRWDDVGGLEDIKQELKEAVEWPIKYVDIFRAANTHPPRGILLHGAPGTGKTLLAKAVASETKVNFISIKGPSLMSKFVGESEKGVREIFKTAKQASPSIIFFDEIDAVVPRRGSGDSNVTERVVSQFLAEMDGIEELKGVVVLAATNRVDMIDPALLRGGRFDLVIELPFPDEDARFAIYHIHTKDKPLGKDVNLRKLAEEGVDLAGSDIEFICRKASMLAIREFINRGTGLKGEELKLPLKAGLKIGKKHFKEALQLVKKQKESIYMGQEDA